MSFGGFMALFMLLLLVPYFFATALVLLLQILYIKRNSWKLILGAFALQISAPIMWVLFANAMESVGWREFVMTVQSIAGILGILLWFVHGKHNQS